MQALKIIAAVVIAAAISLAWLWKRETPAVANGPRAVVAAARTDAPPPVTSQADTRALSATRPAAPSRNKSTGKLSFTHTDGSRESLELQVAGGIALWSPADHRLRVLLTEAPLSPAEE